MDYLANLSAVTAVPELDARMKNSGVTIRRALAPELELVTWLGAGDIRLPGWTRVDRKSFTRFEALVGLIRSFTGSTRSSETIATPFFTYMEHPCLISPCRENTRDGCNGAVEKMT